MLALCCVAGSCEFPLSVPVWTTEWVVDLATETRTTEEFLPTGVQLLGGGGFAFDRVDRTDEVRLENVCEACLCFRGPIPAIDLVPFSFALPLPNSFSSAELSAGQADIVLVNGVGFDLLRNERGQFGLARIDLIDTRTSHIVDSVLSTGPFPPGDSLRFGFDLTGVELQQNLQARVRASIPGTACDSIPITRESAIGALLSVERARADEVYVRVSPASLGLPVETVDLPGFLSDRLRAGEARLILDVETDSELPVDLDLEITIATRADDLYSDQAALFAPVRINGGSPGAPVVARNPLVVDIERLAGADEVLVGARARLLGSNRVPLQGLEAPPVPGNAAGRVAVAMRATGGVTFRVAWLVGSSLCLALGSVACESAIATLPDAPAATRLEAVPVEPTPGGSEPDSTRVPAGRRALRSFAVRALDADGTPEVDVEVRFFLTGGLSGTLTQEIARTNSNGVASTFFTAGTPGSGAIRAQSGDQDIAFSVVVERAPGSLAFRDGPTGTATALPGLPHPDSALVVTVLDTEGLPMPGVTVWFATAGRLRNFADTTDAVGRAESVLRSTRLEAGAQAITAFIIGFPELTQVRTLDLVAPAERVVLVSVEGLRADALDRYRPPHLTALRARAAWWTNARTVLPSLSVPAHLSMWASVEPPEHGILNDSLRISPEMASLDPLFKHAGRRDLEAASYLSPNGPLARFGELLRCRLAFGFDSLGFTPPSSAAVVSAAELALVNPGLDLVFLHLPEPDLAGHQDGFASNSYEAAVHAVDTAIGRIINLVPESTLLILTSPHGGGGAFGERLHGSDSDADVRVPLLVAGPRVVPGQRAEASILDIAPTVLWALGLAPPSHYRGVPLLQGWRSQGAPTSNTDGT